MANINPNSAEEHLYSKAGINTNPAGVHRSPQTLFRDAIKRSLEWESETTLRALVERYTGVKMSLGESNRFSQEVAQIVIKALINA